ncbi:MAG: bifunctional phosphopantothenoylcysteine decarboxylase/phosphopantothenate--cysteine ligase CoaBC [Chlorobi bacterium]|nr:bifunctional phosphopantothenoylcysteine decarboxylase/phosphopantothenate--cysteine ligase CoaBC [Chlorobiota bacterium]
MLKGKKIILGITGSIAAYKSAYLLRLLVKEGAEVQVLMTKAAKEFITPVTMSALSGRPVLGEFFESKDGTWHSHVDLGLWADLMLIAPASANTMGKMVSGICDNLLLTTYLSAKCPVFVAPAMDLDMYKHPATQDNVKKLKEYGAVIIEPATGELASGLSGKGRMEDPEVIVDNLRAFFSEKNKPLKGKTFLITAGPTYEKIDPVRFIGNYSSGKMGFNLAEEAASRGAEVILVSGPSQLKTINPAIKRIDVESAEEMKEACEKYFKSANAAVMSAAVADYTPETVADNKMKRTGDELMLKLKPTTDIAAMLGSRKRDDQVVAGFALETNDARKNAVEKLKKKNLDFIVLNSLEDEGAGFMSDTNKITIIDRENKTKEFPLKTKQEVASDIIDYLLSYLK